MATEIDSHRPLILHTGTIDCLERDCEEYFTDYGDDDPGIEWCSHVTTETVCAQCSTSHPNGHYYTDTVAWPCPYSQADIR